MNNKLENPPAISPDTLRRTALVLAAALITLVFFWMIRGFLIPLVMAAIVAEMSRPLYRRVRVALGGRRHLSAAITLLLILTLVILPVFLVASIAAQQALGLPRHIVTALDELAQQGSVIEIPEWIPIDLDLEDIGPEVLGKIADIVTAVARYTVSTMSAVTRGTVALFLDMFIFLYALFFFIQMQQPVMNQILRFTGLAPETRERLASRAVSVSRATIKGTLVIGVVQGTLGGLGFWAVGIEGATFWGVVTGIVSIIPGVGPGLVLGVGVIYLVAIGSIGGAVALAAWAILVVTTIDNFLRPILIGRDTQMHDILILVSTFGGLGMFGAVGLILGPVVAGLFVTIWRTMSESMVAGAAAEAEAEAETNLD